MATKQPETERYVDRGGYPAEEGSGQNEYADCDPIDIVLCHPGWKIVVAFGNADINDSSNPAHKDAQRILQLQTDNIANVEYDPAQNRIIITPLEGATANHFSQDYLRLFTLHPTYAKSIQMARRRDQRALIVVEVIRNELLNSAARMAADLDDTPENNKARAIVITLPTLGAELNSILYATGCANVAVLIVKIHTLAKQENFAFRSTTDATQTTIVVSKKEGESYKRKMSDDNLAFLKKLPYSIEY